MNDIIGLVAVVGFFVTVVIVVWFVAQTIKYRSSKRAEQMDKLLDKFETAEEFNAFVQSEAGGQLLTTITGGDGSGLKQRSHDMDTIQRGINASAIGLGGTLFGLAVGPDFITGLGIIVLAYGLALLASAYVARQLGEQKIEEPEEQESEDDEVEETPAEEVPRFSQE
jgi:flagellar basal body-associated protein FliL